MSEVISTDSVTLAETVQRAAVREAVELIAEGMPSMALATLRRSVKTCANLDNRPLEPDDVRERAYQLVSRLVVIP